MPEPAGGPSCAPFEPQQYLIQNYSSVEYDGNEAFLEFLVAAYRGVARDATFLEFGGGPALCSPLAAAHAREIHFSDYLEANLDEVRRWLAGRPGAFDWSRFARRILEIESGREVDEAEVFRRCATLRSKLKIIGRCDARARPPLELPAGRRYDVVSANFVINAAIPSKALLGTCLGNICSLLRPGGMLVLTSSLSRPGYRVGEQRFRLVPLESGDLLGTLIGMGFPAGEMEVRLARSDEYGLADGYIFIRATKP